MITAERLAHYRTAAEYDIREFGYYPSADIIITLCDEIDALCADAALGAMVRQNDESMNMMFILTLRALPFTLTSQQHITLLQFMAQICAALKMVPGNIC